MFQIIFFGYEILEMKNYFFFSERVLQQHKKEYSQLSFFVIVI